jgi:hypothetical protein
VGQVLLVGDEAAVGGELDGGGALGRGEVVAHLGRAEGVDLGAEGVDDVAIEGGDATLAVGDVGGPALEDEGVAAADADALLLAQVHDLAGLDDRVRATDHEARRELADAHAIARREDRSGSAGSGPRGARSPAFNHGESLHALGMGDATAARHATADAARSIPVATGAARCAHIRSWPDASTS